jgi:large subunit ribosomal protein L29
MPRRVEKLRDLDTPELEVQQKELGEQIFRLRFQLTTGQSEALARLRSARKELARVKTLLREREVKQKVENGKR